MQTMTATEMRLRQAEYYAKLQNTREMLQPFLDEVQQHTVKLIQRLHRVRFATYTDDMRQLLEDLEHAQG